MPGKKKKKKKEEEEEVLERERECVCVSQLEKVDKGKREIKGVCE